MTTVLPIASRRSANAVANAVFTFSFAGVAFFGMSGMPTLNHCQVPCGIFDDPAIVSELKQACTTIRKAMAQSNQLHSSGDIQSLNQIVRWINTKEEHCSKIITLVSEYLLCQRVKRSSFKSDSQYLDALKVHHEVMQAAMKAKQTMDEDACHALDHAVDDLAKIYTK